MSVFKVASRYAKSLIDLSQEQNQLEEVKTDMEQFLKLLRSSSELQAVLSNPIISLNKKSAVLDALLGSKINPIIIKFFDLMISKGRGELIAPTVVEFVREYNIVKGIEIATVTSAVQLSEAKLEELKAILEKETGSQIILNNKVDEDLIGGFVIKVGDRQVDTSIEGRLNKLERYFEHQGV